MRVRVISVAALLLAIVAYLLLRPCEAGAGPGSPANHDAVVESFESVTKPDTISESLEPSRQPADLRLHARAVDMTGEPLVGAQVHWTKKAARLYLNDDLTFVGLTGKSGSVELPDLPAGIILVRVHGYQPAQATYDGEHSVLLTLLSGASLAVNCSTRDGVPVEGVSLRVSSGAVQLDADTTIPSDSVASGDPTVALHSGVSDGSGRVFLEGLPHGRIHLRAHHPHFALAEIKPRKRGGTMLKSGENNMELLFDPILVGAAVFTEEPLTWSVAMPRDVVLTGTPGRYLELRRQGIMESWPQAAALACCPKFSRRGSYLPQPRHMNLRLLNSSGVWSDHKVPLMQSREFVNPHTIRVANDPQSTVMMGRLVASLRGGRQGGAAPTIHLRERGDHSMRYEIPIKWNEPMLLPVGDYQIGHTDYWVARSIADRDVSIRESTTATIEVDIRHLSPVKLSISDDSGLRHSSAILRFSSTGGRFGRSVDRALDSMQFLLPSGPVDITALAPGCKQAVFRRSISGQRGQRIDLVLERDFPE